MYHHWMLGHTANDIEKRVHSDLQNQPEIHNPQKMFLCEKYTLIINLIFKINSANSIQLHSIYLRDENNNKITEKYKCHSIW